MTALADLFPEADFRFQLALRRGEPREFFGNRDPTGRILQERARWLAADPARHAALRPEGGPLLAEFAELCADQKIVADTSVESGARGDENLAALGASLEPDFLLLSPDENGAFQLRGGVVCFPSGWTLGEKLGRTVDFIHDVVPGLNPALASPIHQFLARLKPGIAFLRDNWGLAATSEFNLHPALNVRPPVPPVALDQLWLRVEHQALVALPRSGGVAFGIRIAVHRLDNVARDRRAAAGLKRALVSMPGDLAAYKRIDAVREAIAALL